MQARRRLSLDNLSTGFRGSVPDGVPFYCGDCADQVLVDSIIKEHNVDTIIHFAASIVVSELVAEPLRYYENNTVKSRALIETAVRCGLSNFIFSSTAAVYGNPVATPIDENSLTAPINPYGRSKLMIEWILSDAGSSVAAQGAVESAVGVLLFQMGIAAFVPLAYYASIAYLVWRRYVSSMLPVQGLVAFGILITLVNGIFQEEALFAPLALGTLMSLAGLALGHAIRAEKAS